MDKNLFFAVIKNKEIVVLNPKNSPYTPMIDFSRQATIESHDSSEFKTQELLILLILPYYSKTIYMNYHMLAEEVYTTGNGDYLDYDIVYIK